MLRATFVTFMTVVIGQAANALAEEYPNVDRIVKPFEAWLEGNKIAEPKIPDDLSNIQLVTKKLRYMSAAQMKSIDFISDDSLTENFSMQEKRVFWDRYSILWENLCLRHFQDLKVIFQKIEWVKVSVYGAMADNDATQILNNCDVDQPFREVMALRLDQQRKTNDTNPQSFAYFFDAVAIPVTLPPEGRYQRYGTIGQCLETGRWEPFPIEDPANVNQRRNEVGLGTIEDYIESCSQSCQERAFK